MLRTMLSLLALALAAGAADAKTTRGSACANGSCTLTASAAIQMPQPVIVQAPPVVLQTAPQANGCAGNAGGCTGSQGSAVAGSSGGSGRHLFSGGILHRARSDSGAGLFTRHKNRGGTSSGYETTTTATVRQWDNRPSPAIVVVPTAPAQAPPQADGQP